MSDDFKKRRQEMLKGWHLLPNGDVSYLPLARWGVIPLVQGVVVGLMFRRGATDTDLDRVQVLASPQECRQIAAALLAVADEHEKALAPSKGPAN
jgi:hypothetical protein